MEIGIQYKIFLNSKFKDFKNNNTLRYNLKVYYYKKVGLGDLSPREFECASKKIFFGSLKKIPDPKKLGFIKNIISIWDARTGPAKKNSTFR